jgi:hypothetical protein
MLIPSIISAYFTQEYLGTKFMYGTQTKEHV